MLTQLIIGRIAHYGIKARAHLSRASNCHAIQVDEGLRKFQVPVEEPLLFADFARQGDRLVILRRQPAAAGADLLHQISTGQCQVLLGQLVAKVLAHPDVQRGLVRDLLLLEIGE